MPTPPAQHPPSPTLTPKIELRTLEMEDYLDIKASMIDAYGNDLEESHWSPKAIERLSTLFPDGQICSTVDGLVVGAALSVIVEYKTIGDSHTYGQIVTKGTFKTHDENGDVLYGIDVFVRPDYRDMRLGRRLYDARKELCERLNLKAIAIGGRMPGYDKHADDMTPQEYIRKVQHKELFDPVLTFQLSNDFHIRNILKDYLPGDHQSRDYAVLMRWNNIYYTPDSDDLIAATKRQVRLGVIQWQMRSFETFEALIEQVEFFVDAVSSYKADFAIFPEYFTAPLMARFNDLPEAQAIRQMTQFAEPICTELARMAISYNVNIIGGSMPVVEDGKLLNIGFLFRRDGTRVRYEKLHITPSEKSSWGMEGGNRLNVVDTDCGPIGVQICYDIEFPELSRTMADHGVQILFVPFQTDTQNGFTRVQACARARAIENECYVVIAGSVGNLPRVNNMDIQYAQSAVFTPSDFAFPTTGVKAEATANTEMTLIVDLDLDDLHDLHNHGSVQNLKDRRKDLLALTPSETLIKQ